MFDATLAHTVQQLLTFRTAVAEHIVNIARWRYAHLHSAIVDQSVNESVVRGVHKTINERTTDNGAATIPP